MIALRGAFGACHLNIARPHPVQGHTATFAFDMYGGNVRDRKVNAEGGVESMLEANLHLPSSISI